MNDITNFIQTVGFPIACVIGLGWFLMNAYNKLNEQSINREQKLFDFITKQGEAMTKLTATNQSFVTVLESFRTDVTEMRSDIEDIKTELRKCDEDE